ncbi:DUF262 domain-containing protein [Agrobacterium leguminum]|uniref:GmrSD restriction endonucleases N-terminal domain-containing protein n=1 Tax=Agrobacterium deltaense NCPPB 1641 TaxID=1183425 RepID=A0A1S7U6M1_9HYPH|nr:MULTISPECIES: DUF262 domain-containing protein [Agrobacterium]WFS68699.1 DUF262 domain-containing protein [Agrobacterium leguminum]CVI62412.1 conserved hypothetical protein [Agrobacterium deltaense NCPPB 1641]
MTTPRPQPKPDSRKYQDLISDIEKGVIKIPKFQREFVWPIEKTAALLDSIVKGYPIGTFILWKTNQRMADVKEVGSISLPPTPDDRQVEYVLDGQQRMTSLFAAYRGARIPRSGSKKITDFAEIYVNLDPTLPDDAQIVVHELPEKAGRCVSLKDVLALNRNVEKRLVAELGLGDDDLDVADKFKQAFATYDFSLVTLTREDIDSAIEVFTRINTGGSVLTLFEIMVAKTYDEERKFDMQVEWNKVQTDLEEVGYDGVSPSTVMQLLALVLAGEAKRSTILGLDKIKVIETWPKAVGAIKSAIDHFRTAYRIPVSALLPYDSLIVPFAYWFFVKRYEPAGRDHLLMRKFFWRSSLGYRYSSAVESKLAADKRAIDDIISGGEGTWDIPVHITGAEGLIGINFATGNSLCKAILCLLAFEQPRNFHNDGTVLLDNSYLKIASSKNFHHFFPKDHLRTNGVGNENSVVNITLIGADLNKRQINAKPPKVYIPKFEASNRTISGSLATHLIDRHGMGIDEDDYGAFLSARAAKLWTKIDELVHPVFQSEE